MCLWRNHTGTCLGALSHSHSLCHCARLPLVPSWNRAAWPIHWGEVWGHGHPPTVTDAVIHLLPTGVEEHQKKAKVDPPETKHFFLSVLSTFSSSQSETITFFRMVTPLLEWCSLGTRSPKHPGNSNKPYFHALSPCSLESTPFC